MTSLKNHFSPLLFFSFALHPENFRGIVLRLVSPLCFVLNFFLQNYCLIGRFNFRKLYKNQIETYSIIKLALMVYYENLVKLKLSPVGYYILSIR